MLIACAGQASTHERHFVHSLHAASDSSGWRGSMPSSQARPQAPHFFPWAVSRHFASSMVGLNVRFSLAIRLMNAESGHSLWHHFLNSSTSAIRMAGTTMSDHVTSPWANRFTSSRMVAKVSPMGHTRQNTGKPKMKVDSSAPPSTKWRASTASPRFFAQLAQPARPFESFSQPVASAAFSSSVSGAMSAVLPSAGFAAFACLSGLVNMPRSFCTRGTGHIQPQNARANTMMSATMMTSDTTARGTIILLASMVPRAPNGQRMEISQMPGAEMVPMPRFVKKPTNTMATMASAVTVRSVLELRFMTAPYLSTWSSGLMVMAREVAPSEMEPFCSDTHTLSQAPQPLHLLSSTTGRFSSSSLMAS